jgi:hypothetical protein
MLVLAMVLAAAAMPWVLERVRDERLAVPASLSQAAPGQAAEPADAAGPPRPPEAPSTAQIEAARSAQIEAARIQQRNLGAATTYPPRPARLTADGERVAPFHGFGLSIESIPAGARVRLDGSDVGETPILTSVDCAPGRDVEVGLERPGFRPLRRTVRCRADALLELTLTLEP